MKKLTQKTVLITGASSGIGAACANALAAEGANIILAARRVDRCEALAHELKQEFDVNTFVLPLDVTNSKQVITSINDLSSPWDQIDILINNAGLAAGLAKVQNSDLADWEQMIDTNLKGLLYVTRAVIPLMLARNMGHIVNVSSIAGREVYAKGAVYCATKHAVEAFTRGLKIDLLGEPIRVTNISPGMVKTEFSLVRFKQDQTLADQTYQGMTPLSGADIADAIVYAVTRPKHVNISEMVVLASDQSAATLVHRTQT